MQVAVLSDIHGNALALSACLDCIRELGVERVFMLGDLVGYFPGECAAYDLLAERGALCQQGNHETYLFTPSARAVRGEPLYQLNAARARLGVARLAGIAAWPARREVEIDGCRMLLVHGTPDDPQEGYVYPDGDLSLCRDLPWDVVFMGHTHRPFVQDAGPVLCVNVGSIGLPRDRGGAAAFALFDPPTRKARIVRVPFDVEEVIRLYNDALPEQMKTWLRRAPAEKLEDIAT